MALRCSICIPASQTIAHGICDFCSVSMRCDGVSDVAGIWRAPPSASIDKQLVPERLKQRASSQPAPYSRLALTSLASACCICMLHLQFVSPTISCRFPPPAGPTAAVIPKSKLEIVRAEQQLFKSHASTASSRGSEHLPHDHMHQTPSCSWTSASRSGASPR